MERVKEENKRLREKLSAFAAGSLNQTVVSGKRVMKGIGQNDPNQGTRDT